MIKDLSYSINEIAPYINWTYFFHAWGFPPRFAQIVEDKEAWSTQCSVEEQEKTSEAIRLFEDAAEMLQLITPTYHTHARFALLPAHSDGDDIIIHCGGITGDIRLPLLRQQHNRPDAPCCCLADFIRPLSYKEPDTIGLFATTVIGATEKICACDKYRSLLIQTLSDRLAEATAEKMHEEVRKTYWGYAKDEQLTMNELFQEKFIGIRPAIGYPSLPDQSTIFDLNKILHLNEMGIQVTESGAMSPHASVCGLMLAHPSSHYFSIGRIGEDQLADYAKRKNMSQEKLRRFLTDNLT